MNNYEFDTENITLEEKIEKLKSNTRFMKIFKFLEFFSAGCSIFFDAEFVKHVYIESYLDHVDYLNNPSSYIYIIFTGLGLASYIECNYLCGILENENFEIQKSIEDGIKIKKHIF